MTRFVRLVVMALAGTLAGEVALAQAKEGSRLEIARLARFSVPPPASPEVRGRISASLLSVQGAVVVFGFEGGQVVALDGVSPQPIMSILHEPDPLTQSGWNHGIPPTEIVHLEWAVDGASFVSFSASGSVQLRAFPSGQVLLSTGYAHGILKAAVDVAGNRALVSDFAGRLLEYSLYPAVLTRILADCSSPIPPHAFGFGPTSDMYWVSYGEYGRSVCGRGHELRSLSTNQLLWSHSIGQEGAAAIVVGADELIFAGSDAEEGRLVNIGTMTSTPILLSEEVKSVTELSGQRLAVGLGIGYVGIRNLATSQVRRIPGPFDKEGLCCSANVLVVPVYVRTSIPPFPSDLIAPSTTPRLQPHPILDQHGYYEVEVYSFGVTPVPWQAAQPGDEFFVAQEPVSSATSEGATFRRAATLIGHSSPALLWSHTGTGLVVSAVAHKNEIVFWPNTSIGYVAAQVDVVSASGGVKIEEQALSIAPSGQVVSCLSGDAQEIHLFDATSAGRLGTYQLFHAGAGTEQLFAWAATLVADGRALVSASDRQLYWFDVSTPGVLTSATAGPSNTWLPHRYHFRTDVGDFTLARPIDYSPEISSDATPKIVSSSSVGGVSGLVLDWYSSDNWGVFLPSMQSWILPSKGGLVSVSTSGAIQVVISPGPSSMTLTPPGRPAVLDRVSRMAARYGNDSVLLLCDTDTLWKLDFAGGAYGGLHLLESDMQVLLAGDVSLWQGHMAATSSRVFVSTLSGEIVVLAPL